DEDRERRTNGTADDAVHPVIVFEDVELRVIARPSGGAMRAARRHEMTHDIAIGIEDADFGHIDCGNAFLTAGFAKQGFRREHRCGSMIFLGQDWGTRTLIRLFWRCHGVLSVFLAGRASFMTNATTAPDIVASTPTAAIAHTKPNKSANSPEAS